jgi:tRNA(Ile)-lysidine synthase
MPAVIDLVRHFVRRHDLIRPDTAVVAAVSGGSDSVALAHLLAELDARGELRLVGLAHFNHQLRSSAGDDERFVQRLAETLRRPLAAEREDVSARARRERRSLEDAARAARHAGLERARIRFLADVVALGHTRDDQAETFLLRLLRGAGPRGLAGMHPRNGRLVRPLLECRRDDLRAWLADRGIAFVEDETNVDVAIPRNRIRAELLPLLRARFNPRIVETLADEAELAREIWSWLEEQAEAFGTDLEVGSLMRLPPALRRFVLWRAMKEAAGGRPVSFGHVNAALGLIQSGEGAIDLPGHRLHRNGTRIVLISRSLIPAEGGGQQRKRTRKEPGSTSSFTYPLPVPGEVVVAESGWVVSARFVDPLEPLDSKELTCSVVMSVNRATGHTNAPGSSAVVGSGPVALVRSDLVHGTLAVRNRRAGDRFRPVGLNGSRKLQDLFVDRKVARAERDGVPLVVDGEDRIVWVAGFGIDEAFRVTDASQGVLLLKLTRLVGGSA